MTALAGNLENYADRLLETLGPVGALKVAKDHQLLGIVKVLQKMIKDQAT